MTPEAISHLSAADAVMRRILREIGPCTLVPELRRPPFQSLVRAVAHQQLNGTAANTILTRFIKLFPGRRFPRPGDLASVSDEDLRHVGFSRAKVASIRDIAAKTLDGTIPASKKIHLLTDEEIIARLIEVRGVGRWTVVMLLIFQLGRTDVLPADDFGVRQGFRVAYGREAMPSVKEVLANGECWRPFRTTAAWYLWRVADRARKQSQATKTAA
jgi:DNA-3-methyladenine glycosylase II